MLGRPVQLPGGSDLRISPPLLHEAGPIPDLWDRSRRGVAGIGGAHHGWPTAVWRYTGSLATYVRWHA